MRKQGLILAALLVSLLANVLLGYGYFSKATARNEDVKLQYAKSIDLIKSAQSILENGDTGTKETSRAFNSFEMIHLAQLAMKEYEQPFVENGIRVQNLQTMLQEISIVLMEETSKGINGQDIDQGRLTYAQKNVKQILDVLPPHAEDEKNLQEAFMRLAPVRQ